MIDLLQYQSECAHNAPIVTCKDKRSPREYRAINNNLDIVRKYQVDGLLVTDQTEKKCDFMVINDTKSAVYLIELKGSDLSRAIEQLLNSKKLLSNIITEHNRTLYRIVYRANTHAIRGSDYARFKNTVGAANVSATTDRLEECI